MFFKEVVYFLEKHDANPATPSTSTSVPHKQMQNRARNIQDNVMLQNANK